jgi:hypothetical protein
LIEGEIEVDNQILKARDAMGITVLMNLKSKLLPSQKYIGRSANESQLVWIQH